MTVTLSQVVGASQTQLTIGWVFIVAGFVLVLLAVPALLKKAFTAQVQDVSWGDIIGKLLDLGPAGIVAALGVILIIVGLVLVGIEIPDIS